MRAKTVVSQPLRFGDDLVRDDLGFSNGGHTDIVLVGANESRQAGRPAPVAELSHRVMSFQVARVSGPPGSAA
jgi:hypothetical protein